MFFISHFPNKKRDPLKEKSTKHMENYIYKLFIISQYKTGNKYNFIYPISGFSLSLFFILYYFFIYSSKQVQQYPLLLSYSC